jgi:large subunit ribosomal protein L4
MRAAVTALKRVAATLPRYDQEAMAPKGYRPCSCRYGIVSPLWRGGGKIFPNSPEENFTHKVNKKMYRAGICSICRNWFARGACRSLRTSTVEAPKTKLLADKLKGLGLGSSVLVITDTLDENLLLASRNLRRRAVVEPRHADPVSLVHYKNVIVTKSAIAKIEEMLA